MVSAIADSGNQGDDEAVLGAAEAEEEAAAEEAAAEPASGLASARARTYKTE